MAGVYAVMCQTVGRREREIGIRLALGAGQGEVVRMVAGQAMLLVGIGSGVGLVTGIFASRALAGLPYGVNPADLTTVLIAVSGDPGAGGPAGELLSGSGRVQDRSPNGIGEKSMRRRLTWEAVLGIAVIAIATQMSLHAALTEELHKTYPDRRGRTRFAQECERRGAYFRLGPQRSAGGRHQARLHQRGAERGRNRDRFVRQAPFRFARGIRNREGGGNRPAWNIR